MRATPGHPPESHSIGVFIEAKRQINACVVCTCMITAPAGPVFARSGEHAITPSPAVAEQQCLASVQAEIVSRQRLGSKAIRMTGQFELPESFDLAVRDLEDRLGVLAAPGHLLRASSGPWTVFSYWQQDLLCMVQLRRKGAGSAGLISATRYAASGRSRAPGRSAVVSVPDWWPTLASQKALEWLDGDSRVVTVVARARENPARFASRLMLSGKAAGLHLSARFSTDERAELPGTVLILEGAGERVSVSLFPTSPGTGVVAHIRRSLNR